MRQLAAFFKTRPRAVGGALAALALMIVAAAGLRALRPGADRFPISRKVHYGFVVHNTTNRVVQNSQVWVQAPVKQSASQVCASIETSLAATLSVDRLNNQVLCFAFPEIAPLDTKIIAVAATVRLADAPNRSADQDLQPYLKPEKFCEADSPPIHQLADSLKRGSKQETARSIFDWVSRHIAYSGYQGRPRGAVFALKAKSGDCTELMYLFMALCRAAGIPARGVGGYLCHANAVFKSADYHNWAEFHDGSRWQIVDCQNKVFMGRGSGFVAMEVLGADASPLAGSGSRFHCKGQGLKVRMSG
jgi:transglutaminase-like putative cysteine protease